MKFGGSSSIFKLIIAMDAIAFFQGKLPWHMYIRRRNFTPPDLAMEQSERDNVERFHPI